MQDEPGEPGCQGPAPGVDEPNAGPYFQLTAPQMPALQPELVAHPHRNRRLFSDHYLDTVLPALGEWRAGAEGAAGVRDEIAALYAKFVPSTKEAQTEEELIKPILRLLGHAFEVQPSLKTPDGWKVPDYVLYAGEAARRANKNVVLSDAVLQHALAVADAKYWDRPLDQALKVGNDPFTNKNPGYQISFYIQHTGLPWGILTNGRLWRLYHKDSAHKLDRYFEIDLPELLKGGPERFQYFLRFFERAAFEEGPLSLNRHLEASERYARKVGDSLRDQVYEALLHIAQGLLDNPRNGLQRDATTLKRIYDNALILLYRLLFILFAEARELLPVEASGAYRDRYSLYSIKREVARDLKLGPALLSSTVTLWPRLTELFNIINLGSPPLKVATFNGGLFDPERHPALEQWAVGDARLQQAIDKLARVGGEFVDYRDLSERQLGTIYEGLLEFQLRPLSRAATVPDIRPEPDTGSDPAGGLRPGVLADAGVSGGGKGNRGRDEVTATEPDIGNDPAGGLRPGVLADAGVSGGGKGDRLAAEIAADEAAAKDGWSVKLVTDKGERKASGSYYTPGFITRFMVEQAVGPLLDGALAKAAPKGASAQVQAVLDLNILDCAMGSGHFLVEAVEYLARRLVEADVLPVDLPTGPGFDELTYWKRRAAQSCIYGVDLNPLAVDLAKLSLWLTTAAKDRPLSFLDHHLRPGNALVGARIADLSAGVAPKPKKKSGTSVAKKLEKAEAGGQLTWAADSAFTQSMALAVGNMWLIEESAGATVEDVKTQERQYEAVRDSFTRKYSRLADLVTATRFGLAIDASLWGPLSDYASGRTIAALPQFKAWISEADALAEQHRFFHWELEFPEVFFDRFGRALGGEAGFDVVIGNPPYVRQELLRPLKPYLQSSFASFHGVADLFVYFYEQAFGLLRKGGRMAYIVTNKWMRAGYGEALRTHLASQFALESIIDFGHAPIFKDVDVFPCILVLDKPVTAVDREVQITEFPRESLHVEELDRYVRAKSHTVAHQRFTGAPWSLEPNAVNDLLEKIRAVGQPLAEYAGTRILYGIKTGLNEAFLIDDETRQRLINQDASCKDLIRPYLRGQDVERWRADWQQLWMIVLKSSGNHIWPWSNAPEPESAFARCYPSLHRHLKPLETKLRERQDQGQYWWELRACKYYDAFEKPKVVYQEIQFHPSYALDSASFYANNKVFLLPSHDPYLLAVLNSPLMWWHNWRFLPHMKDEALSPVAEKMENLPIAPATDEVRSHATDTVPKLLNLTEEVRSKRASMLDWLQTEFQVLTAGQKLCAFDALDAGAFVEEVRRARPRGARRLTPASLNALQETFASEVLVLHHLQTEVRTEEATLSGLINQAYGLSPEEDEVMRGSAPPRTPKIG